jgi:hypothetical protein
VTNRVAQYAIVHPALFQESLFRPLVRGARKTLDLSLSFGGEVMCFRSEEQLGIPEQSVLLAVCALCGLDRRQLTHTPETTTGVELRAKLMAKGGLAEGISTLSAKTSYHKLLLASGMQTGGSSYARLLASLARLSKVTVSTTIGTSVSEMQLISYVPSANGEGARIAIHWFLTRAIVGAGQFSKVSLDERHALQTDAARCLHAWLSAFVREKQSMKLAVQKAAGHIWGTECSDSASRKRNMKVRDLCLNEIGQLQQWEVSIVGNQVVVRRNGLDSAKA